MSTLRENMNQLHELKAEVKRRCMIFDVEAKERVARKRGLPLDTYYHASFDEWIAIRKAYEAEVQP